MKNLKIAAAQVPSLKGDINANIEIHLKAIARAGELGVSFLFFPELSLTGYEPELAMSLIFSCDDPRLKPLLQAAQKYKLFVVVGAPLGGANIPQIGALIISPGGEVDTYAKMHLHPGEEKFFTTGGMYKSVVIGHHKIAVAICADANSSQHVRACSELGCSVYTAGMLISEAGYVEDADMLKEAARKNRMLMVMANHNHPTGMWFPVGKSAIWNEKGKMVAANETQNALVIAEFRDDKWTCEVIEIQL